jgi:hypothetical protein
LETSCINSYKTETILKKVARNSVKVNEMEFYKLCLPVFIDSINSLVKNSTERLKGCLFIIMCSLHEVQTCTKHASLSACLHVCLPTAGCALMKICNQGDGASTKTYEHLQFWLKLDNNYYFTHSCMCILKQF